MSFLKSFFGAMAAAEISDKKRVERERQSDEKKQLNDEIRVLHLEQEFLDYMMSINCRNVSDFDEAISAKHTPEDTWQTKRVIDHYKEKLKEYMRLGGEPAHITEFAKMDLYIEIVRRLKEYGWLNKQDQYVKYADDTYWLDRDWEKERVKRDWLSELLTLSSNEIKQVTKKDSSDFVPYDVLGEKAVRIQNAYFLPKKRDAGTELFEASISIKLTDEHIICYDGDTREEMHYKSTVSNNAVQVLCSRFTSELTAVDLNGIYVIINTNEVGQIQSFCEGHNDRVQNENRQAYEGIDTLSGVEFERVCKRLLESMGFTVETTKASGDGGIDLIGYNTQPLLSGKYIIQCKRYAGSVGEPIIRDLYGVVTSERANKGILITTGYFTKSAIAFAENKPIELMDGAQLKKLIVQYLGAGSLPFSSMQSATSSVSTHSATYHTIERTQSTSSHDSVCEQKVDMTNTEVYVHNSAITTVLGQNSMNSQGFAKWEAKLVQNPADLKVRCRLAEILHNALLGRISDANVSSIDFQNAAQQLANLVNPIIQETTPGRSRQEDYRYYMSCAVAGECDIWTGNIVDAIIKWDTVVDAWGELSGEVMFCSNFRAELLVSVVSCLELMGFGDIADNYRNYWIERLNTENVALQQNGMLFTMLGNSEAIEMLETSVLEPTLVGFILSSSDDGSVLMCENGVQFSSLESWFIENCGSGLIIREKESSENTEILKDLNAHVSARSKDVLAYFGEKYA